MGIYTRQTRLPAYNPSVNKHGLVIGTQYRVTI